MRFRLFSDVSYWTWEPPQNFEFNPLFNRGGGVDCSNFVNHDQVQVLS